MLAITVFALFGDDLRLAVTDKSADDGFSAMMIVCLILFSLEIIATFIVRPEYRFSFFFWLDLLSTVSLIFDVNWVWNLIQSKSSGSFVQSTQLARASRASRAGTRAARIIRVIRVIRLIRIVKLYKLAQSKLKKKDAVLFRGAVSCRGGEEVFPMNLSKIQPENIEYEENSISQNFDSFGDLEPGEISGVPVASTVQKRMTTMKRSITVGDAKAEIAQESKVGKKLSELTTMRVIVLVLVMIIILPFFNLSYYVAIDQNQFGLGLIDNYINSTADSTFFFNEYIDQYSSGSTPLIYLEVASTDLSWNSSNPDDFRDVEIEIVTLDKDSDYEYLSFAVFNLKSQSALQAGMNMLKTFFICMVLSIGSIMFSKDANELVLEPLENMIQTVRNIANNPLKAVQEEERQAVLKEEAFEGTIVKTKASVRMLETQILEKLIIKIGALMALGFGEAGSTIIAKNMAQSKGDVDPMIPGKRQLCIFGFCDIRQFPDVTEVLEHDIMFFVNGIAAIVHQHVDEYLGATNKNLGDVFVLVWKFPEEIITKDKNKNKVLIASHPFIPQFSDLAVISYIKIISEINTNTEILKWNDYQPILNKLPNFKVKMGFGMHFGWGIEGAIGSEYKIDASYLSPNVNLASRLCAATKQYGVWMLISQQVHNLLSEKMKRVMRKLDRVTFKGSAEPMDIFTIDLITSHLEIYTPKPVLSDKFKKRARVSQRLQKEELRKDLWSGAYKAVRRLKEEPDLKRILLEKNPEFIHCFENAIAEYLAGNWKTAKIGFEKALELKEGDGPCMNLIHFISEHGGNPPSNWEGYRKLLEK